MVSTYKLNTRELAPNFIVALQTAYPNKDVEIVVQEVQDDETSYLLSDPANKEHLLQAIDDIQNGKNLVSLTLPDLP
jgi:hypothetical protein